MTRVRDLIIGAGAGLAIGLLTACGATSSPAASPSSGSPATAQSVSSVAASPSGPSSSSPAPSAPMTPSPPTAAASSASPSTPSSSTAVPIVPSTKPTPGAKLTLTGTVEKGVEPSCLLLTDVRTGLRVNLYGGDPAVVKAGAEVTVTGTIAKGMMSYCQQGQIFQVQKATTK